MFIIEHLKIYVDQENFFPKKNKSTKSPHKKNQNQNKTNQNKNKKTKNKEPRQNP